MVELSLSVSHLTKHFGPVRAVNDLSFTVRPGRVTGFMGPNGAGKTTTLRMLLGLVIPTSGAARVNGEPYTSLSEPARTVGSHLDSSAFNPGRNARQHMRVVAAAGGLDTRRIDPLLSIVGLIKDADRRVGGYSLGMRQRLGLATALLGDPQILILDEPANGLDPEGIQWLRSFLRSFAAEGKIVFLSSHLLDEVQQIATDVVIINNGNLLAAGGIEELELEGGSRVVVDAADIELLGRALEASRLEPTQEYAGGPLIVQGTSAQEVGNIALVAGVPLRHLSEHTANLEDLFMDLVGGTR